MPEVDVIEIAQKIKLIAMDVDGVLTNGHITYDSAGRESKQFYVRDGSALYFARVLGFHLAIITGRESEVVIRRAKELGITELHQNIKKKWECLHGIMTRLKVEPDETAFLGDDLLDLPLMRQVGLPIAPADAVLEVRAVARFVTPSPGGRGAVREGIELILKAQGHWERVVQDALVDVDLGGS